MASKPTVKRLDTVFSQYVRLRDSKDGIIICCSCGKMVPWKESDAGHFVNRRWTTLRWDETNVHAQCRACNRFDEGNIPGYSMFIRHKYGDEKIAYLLAAKGMYKWTDFELELLIKEYRQKVKDLLK